MRYSTDEALRRTLEKAALLRQRSTRRRRSALSAGACFCVCALLAMGYALSAQGGAALWEADYGAFLLPSQAGGYILAGVLAFAAGVMVTLLCLRYRDHAARPKDGLSGRRESGSSETDGEEDPRRTE